jgi:REP element-mobilizing transposase RayT
MIFDPQKHHRRSIRAKGHDYRQAGAYFITICTHERICLFGDVMAGVTHLSAAGEKVLMAWCDLPDHHAGLELDAFTVMPNHVHGILFLPPVDAPHANAIGAQPAERFGRSLSGSLGTIVRSFKSASSRAIHTGDCSESPTVWQRNYFERIIRSEAMLNSIRQYIDMNPANWPRDEENPRHGRPTGWHQEQ